MNVNYAKTPTIYQMEATECGAASLDMIFAYYGHELPLETMRMEVDVSRDGCNARNMMKAARKYGLECHAYSKDTEALREIPVPAIIHWNFNHFVVFEGIKGKKAYLNDPAVGRRCLTWEELSDGFTGIVMTFKPTDAFKKEKLKSNIGVFLLNRLRGEYAVLFKLLYIGLLLIFPCLVLPVVSQVFMDDVLNGQQTSWLTKILVFMGGLALLRLGLSYYRALLLKKLQAKMKLLSGYGFLRHMLRLPISFFDQRYSGDLVSRLESNTEVNDFLAGDLAETVLNLFTAMFYLVILLLYSPVMTMICLGNVAVCMIMMWITKHVLSNSTMKMQMSGGRLQGAVCAGIGISDTIKATGAETQYTNRLIGFQTLYSRQEQQMMRFQKLIGVASDATGKITDVLLLAVGGWMVIRGQMTMGMLMAFNSMFDSFNEPVNELVGFFQKILTTKSNIRRVKDIEGAAQDVVYTQKERNYASAKLSGDIELEDISFGYSRLRDPLIEHFSVSVERGQVIAFVGPSGCGKSTLSKIISGLYQPWEGSLRFDGHSINEISTNTLHSSVATVNQQITLFSGTIRENLTLWDESILDSDLEKAVEDACIDDVIMKLPGGFDYRLDENGSNLSGGQRQRLEIARALAGNPSVLIMDEATSALDPIVEKKVMDNLRKRGCTCVIVAHRLSAIRDANLIVVLRQGKVIQMGTHQSLMQDTDGFYHHFVQNI